MLRYPRILAIIAVGAEYVVRNSAKAGIPLINARRFLVQVSIGGIESESAATALDLSLKGVGLTVTEVSITHQKVSLQRVRSPIELRLCGPAITGIRITRSYSVSDSGVWISHSEPPTDITWPEFVQVRASNQAT